MPCRPKAETISQSLIFRITGTMDEKLYGYEKSEVMGKNFDFMLTEDTSNDYSFGKQMRATGNPVHFDSYRLGKGDKRIPVNIALSPIKDQAGNIIATSSIHKDLTQQIAAEEEIRSLNAVLGKRVEARTSGKRYRK